MNKYTAKVVSKDGKKSTVTDEAISKALFEDSLTSKGFYIIEVKEASLKKNIFQTSKIKKGFVLDFTNNVYSLLDFGIDINEVFKILLDVYATGEEHEFIKEVNQFLKKGKRLSDAVKSSKYNFLFDDFFITMISSGEQSGNLTESFKLISNYIKNLQKLKEKMMTASIYPSILLILGFSLLNLLFLFIIPNFKTMYENIDITPSLFIQIFFNISGFLINNFILYVVFLAALVITIVIYLRTGMAKKLISYVLNNFPVISKVAVLQKKIKISFSLEILLKGGSSLEDALKKLSDMEQDKIMQKEYIKSINTLKEGGKLKNAFKNLKVFDIKDLNIIEISDSISKTPEGFNKIHIEATNKLETFLELVFKLLEPVIILLVGFFVFFIMYIVISPTLELMKNFGN